VYDSGAKADLRISMAVSIEKQTLASMNPARAGQKHSPRHENFKPAHECSGVQLRTREIPELHPRNEKERGRLMIGDQIGEVKGKRVVRRVISVNPPTAEVSFEDSGTILGIAVTGIGTYTSVVGPDGSLHGTGQGMEMTGDGEALTWSGTGVGKFGPGGSVTYRGMLFFRSASPKFAAINNGCGAFEYEIDGEGNTASKYWQWK
jgi:hypothetical protein